MTLPVPAQHPRDDDGRALALPTVTAGAMPGLAVIGEWLTAAKTAEELVTPLVGSHFVPDAYKPRIPANATAEERADAFNVARANATSAVLLGLSIGLDPLTALQQIYVVKGRPGMYAKLKVALAQARGHRVWDEEYGAERVTVAGVRKGSEDVVRITLTIDDAKRAGWTSNDNYAKTPADMLWARAASRVVDRIAADVLMGLASVEDLEDAEEPEPEPARARVTVSDVVARPAVAPPAAEEPAPVGSAPLPSGGQPVAAPEPLSEKTWRAIGDAFVALEVTGPGQTAKRLAILSKLLDRSVEGRADVSEHDGRVVVDTLRGLDDEGRRWLGLAPVEPPAPPAAPVDEGDPYGGADPDADVDDVPEPDDDERAAAQHPAPGAEPAGWDR